MKIEKIITMANRNVRLQFSAMERSLRAVGCNLPLVVIPYDEGRFDLPGNSNWWTEPEVFDWLSRNAAHPLTRKYQCMTTSHYQFVDSDVIFLRNPETVLQDHSGFVTSCTEWNRTQWSYKPETEVVLCQITSTWKRNLFNVGQFACDQVVASCRDLQSWLEGKPYQDVCLHNYSSDQVGMNLLIAMTKIPYSNLTLPPFNMESSWAGDYPAQFVHLWQNVSLKPYLIHWAGTVFDRDLPINQLFSEFLTAEERQEWQEQKRQRLERSGRDGRWPFWIRAANQIIPFLDKRFKLQWLDASAAK